AAWTQEGSVAAAHSRYHSRTKGSPQIFLSEVPGSLADLANRGHPSSVCVQPGTWEDSLNVDTAAKLENWRGAVFQTFTTVFEGYARPASVSLPLADSMAMGLGHLTVSNGAPVASVLRWWQLAQKPGHFTVLMAHSASLTNPDDHAWMAAMELRGMARDDQIRRGPLLVAGATGWVGRTLLKLAREDGFQVVGVARQPDESNGFERCDVSQRDAVDRLFQRLRPRV